MDIYQRFKITCRAFYDRHSDRACNAITPVWYLTCVIGLNWMLHDHIFDYLHGKGTQQSTIARWICWFFTAEMIVNWIFLCTVKSNYINTEEHNAKRLQHEKTNPQFTSEGVEYEKLKELRPTMGTGNWSVITHYTGSEVKRTAYPYWGWKPCIVCSCYKPPRCHHCTLCDSCVLKRDHHCFFIRQCVGLNNQRFFVVFNFWAVLLTAFVIPQIFHYTTLVVWPGMKVQELFLPWTLVSFLIGWTNLYTLFLISQNWSMVFFFLTAGTFLSEQLRCIDAGKTPFELDHKDHEIQTRCKSRYERFTCVFGRNNIWINFLIPYHWVSEPVDDGSSWQSMKMQ